MNLKQLPAKLLTGFCLLLFLVPSQAQQHSGPVAKRIRDLNERQAPFRPMKPFTLNSVRDRQADEVLAAAQYVTLDQEALKALRQSGDETISFTFPFKEKEITVQLFRVELLTEDFSVITSQSHGQPIAYTPGLYYRGTVKGNERSIASFSFFNDEMMGVVSDDENGNVVIGKMINRSSTDYIIYSDRDFTGKPASSCETYDDPAYAEQLKENIERGAGLRTVKCVRLYYEVDYDIYLNSGSNTTTTTNWMTSVANNVATLYSNDDVTTAISEIFLWTTPDPFTGSSSSARLSSFQSNRTSFNGDLAQLVAIDPNGLGGVAATINGFCGSNSLKMCYSDVEYSYNNVPTYSWTIEVLTHEFGHLFGSYHTHNCSWPIGALDNCGPVAGYPTEGGCPSGPAPSNGGTIMSYCHLTSYGINFNNGFGSYPSDAIRGAVDAEFCLGTSCTGGGSGYCYAQGSNASEEWIETVTFGTFTNNSGSSAGYEDFTGLTITMAPGSAVSFTLTPAFNGGPWSEYFSIWIDYNNDLDFTDAGENVYNSAGTSVAVNGSFTIPSGESGTTRMRITMKYDATATSCESFDYGEVEDYTVSFTGGGGVSYCASKGNSVTNEWIDFAKLGTWSRTSAKDGGYYDGTSTLINVTKGLSYNLKYSANMSGGTFTEYWKVWIDYNHDGDFDDAGENIATKTSNSKAKHSATIVIPATAATAATRIRYSMKRGSYPGSCETFSQGEVEDYTVNILPQLVQGAVEAASSMKLYPNPANDELTIELDGITGKGNLHILDLSGRLMHSAGVAEGQTWVDYDPSQLAPGMYVVRIVCENGIALSARFIRE